jgi:hypothetical protein
MPNVHSAWTVLPHSSITEIDDGILTVTGQIHMPLVDLQRRMTVVRLRDGSSVIYSAMALDDDEMKQIETWAVPRYLVVPGDAHRLDARIFKDRYPTIRVITPPGARRRVARAVEVDSTDADFGDPDVKYLCVAGAGGHEAALLVHRQSGSTLIVNDLIGNLRRQAGFGGWLLHIMGFGDDDPQIPTVERMLMIVSNAQFREQLLSWAEVSDLGRIVMSHGELIQSNPSSALRKLAETLH